MSSAQLGWPADQHRFSKRVLDICGASALLVLTSPVLAAAAVSILIDTGRPILFRQERIGQHGRIFRMSKFRTMRRNAQYEGTGLFSYEGDSRITRSGKWLRISSIDELPQLLNVMHGDMSLVGPRPPVVGELGEFEDFTGALYYRFKLKPGITGLAQVSGRNNLDWDEKVILDTQYLDSYGRLGVREDIRILFATAVAVLAMRNTIEQPKE